MVVCGEKRVKHRCWKFSTCRISRCWNLVLVLDSVAVLASYLSFVLERRVVGTMKGWELAILKMSVSDMALLCTFIGRR